LNDGDDLRRLIHEISPALDPDQVSPVLTTDQLFDLLSLEAEYRAITAYGIYVGGLYEAGGEAALPADAQDTAARLRKLAETRRVEFAKLREQFGVTEQPAMAGAAEAGV
jgi:hypothetical protein